MSWTAEQLPANWRKNRILIWSGDRSAGGTTKDYRVQIPTAPSQVVYIDLASSSVVGYLLKIDELDNAGMTSSGVAYWRFPTDLTNTRMSPHPDHLLNPRALSHLSIHWRNPSGSTISATIPEHTIELEVWERNAESGL
jgi:hypothetical protein